MKIVRQISELPPVEKLAVSIGNFDGVHAGHRILLQALCQNAHRLLARSVAVTFDPHPLEILRPGTSLPRLNSLERKAELLGNCGVDFLYVLKTDHELLTLDYQSFFKQYVLDHLQAVLLVEGPNFFFGHNRAGTVEHLGTLCRENSIELKIVEMAGSQEGMISSSLVRTLIETGRMEEANRLLVDPYQIKGKVEKGEGRGKEIGFPTANLTGIQTLLPLDGVYGGSVRAGNLETPCAISIGPNPTFAGVTKKVEVHLIDRDLDVYGEELSVAVLLRIRDMMKFESVEALALQIGQDVNQIRETVMT